jgi:hypothetical protein
MKVKFLNCLILQACTEAKEESLTAEQLKLELAFYKLDVTFMCRVKHKWGLCLQIRDLVKSGLAFWECLITTLGRYPSQSTRDSEV